MSDATVSGLPGTNRRTGDAILDPTSGSQIVITHEHHMIHVSNAWEFSQVKLALAQNGTILIQLEIGARDLHLKELRVWGDAAAASFELIEAPTLTTGTTAVPTLNMNRSNGAPAPTGVTMFNDPTVISGGTELVNRLFGGGAGIGQTAYSGTDKTDREWVLKTGVRYLIRVTNLEANARNFSVDGFFYLESVAS